MIIWSDEILEKIGDERDCYAFIKIGEECFPILGIEDSQNIGWYEIRYSSNSLGLISTITSGYLLNNLPKGQMVMIQEGGHFGKSYPINSVFKTFGGRIILKCENPDSEYWDELEKWKIRQDNIRIGITNFIRDELEKRKQ